MNKNQDYIEIAVESFMNGAIFQVIVKTKDGHISALTPEIYEERGDLAKNISIAR
jgi:hypothetical protein